MLTESFSCIAVWNLDFPLKFEHLNLLWQITLHEIIYTHANFILSKANFKWSFVFTSITQESHQWRTKTDKSQYVLELKQLSFWMCLETCPDKLRICGIEYITTHPLSLLAFMLAPKECITSWYWVWFLWMYPPYPFIWCWFPGFGFHISVSMEIL